MHTPTIIIIIKYNDGKCIPVIYSDLRMKILIEKKVSDLSQRT